MIVPLTPLDFGRRAFRHYPDKPAVVDGTFRATYREFAARVYRFASRLEQEGLRPGDRVAVLAPNSHQLLEAFYAVPWMGGVLVPLNTRLAAQDYAYILEHSGSRWLFVDRELLPAVADVVGSLERVMVFGGVPADQDPYETWLAGGDPTPRPYVVADENDLITLNYTSGTTARPKGVMLTHRNTFLNATDVLLHLGLRRGERYLHALPMFHVNGWGGVWAVTGVGGVHVISRRADGPVLWDLIHTHRIDAMCGAPVVLNAMANTPHRPPEVPLRLFTGGAPPPAALVERFFREGIAVVHVYGLTETGPWATISEPLTEAEEPDLAERSRRMSYQGIEQLMVGQVQVHRPDGTEVAWNGEGLGEIAVRGNTVMAGYYRQPEETDKAIRGGWFYTGDLAVVHPDGSIQIRDRAKDVIISGGENISSIEVEDVLYRHPAVLEAAVIAVPHERWGETPKAIVVLKPGHTATAEELIAFCRERLAHFKCPTSVDFVEALPHTASGKIQKFQLREPYWRGYSERVRG
ncbi:MAG: long-chain-fatty-acid--CoA ligase [Actinomycetia bacterium]|nr:long-chain-fatty-acid--CoA ligase [Actinomycetes bacterium]